MTGQIICTVVAMGKSLGVRVLAEGVEQTSQLALLRQVGCDEAQGYLLSPPCPAEQIPDLLAEAMFRSDGCYVPLRLRFLAGNPARDPA